MHADEFAVSWKWSIGGKRDDDEHVPQAGIFRERPFSLCHANAIGDDVWVFVFSTFNARTETATYCILLYSNNDKSL